MRSCSSGGARRGRSAVVLREHVQAFERELRAVGKLTLDETPDGRQSLFPIHNLQLVGSVSLVENIVEASECVTRVLHQLRRRAHGPHVLALVRRTQVHLIPVDLIDHGRHTLDPPFGSEATRDRPSRRKLRRPTHPPASDSRRGSARMPWTFSHRGASASAVRVFASASSSSQSLSCVHDGGWGEEGTISREDATTAQSSRLSAAGKRPARRLGKRARGGVVGGFRRGSGVADAAWNGAWTIGAGSGDRRAGRRRAARSAGTFTRARRRRAEVGAARISRGKPRDPRGR